MRLRSSCRYDSLKLVPARTEILQMSTRPSPPEREEFTDLGGFHASPVPMWIFDQSSLAILEVNGAAERQYGYLRSEFLKMTILDIRPLEEIPKVLRRTLRAQTVRPNGEFWIHRRKNGNTFQATIMSREITFQGRNAELVSAQEVRAASARN